MPKAVVYIKCNRNVEVQSPDVFMRDVGSLRCEDTTISAKLKALKVHHFKENEEKRCVISTLRLVELMEKVCPNIIVQIIGEPDVLIEWVAVDKYKGCKQWLKVIVVCLICFCGTGFTIIAYHNEAGVNEIFSEVYKMLMNREPGTINILEVSYSVGLALGIIGFFNHIGGRRITKDPTPIEVAMRNYEQDVDKTLIETAGRMGREEEV